MTLEEILKHEKEYPSLFRWKYNEIYNRLDLISRHGGIAASVYIRTDNDGHNWFVWDTNGTGGENSRESTIEQAKIAAESAVLRWGRHRI